MHKYAKINKINKYASLAARYFPIQKLNEKLWLFHKNPSILLILVCLHNFDR